MTFESKTLTLILAEAGLAAVAGIVEMFLGQRSAGQPGAGGKRYFIKKLILQEVIFEWLEKKDLIDF